jgi:predicted nucleic acid-binding Zn ribbon protein
VTDRPSGFALSTADMQAEIDRDRRAERRLVWYTVIALAAVAIVVATRLIFL